jgi:ferredoxin
MTLLPVIDEAACAAHGDCAVVAPDVFVVEDVAVVVADGSPELVRAAAEACPSAAIELVDRETGARVFP